MSWRAGVAWASCAVAVAGAALGAGLLLDAGRPLLDGDNALGIVLAVSNSVLGAFIVTRWPGHPIGWLFVATALTRGLAVAGDGWSTQRLPGWAYATWLQTWIGVTTIAAAPLLVVLFPDGRLLSRRWRVVPVLAALSAGLLGLVIPVLLWPYRGPSLLPEAPVPDTAVGHLYGAILGTGAALALLAIVIALASVPVRFRRSTGDERQQIKWFGYAAALTVALDLGGLAAGQPLVQLLGALVVVAGIGLGVFRYRLYDIDRLINRTLVYGVLTVGLAAVFAAIDVLVARMVGGESAVVAAASAFVVALLLRPARARVQDGVDRLFDRRTYDRLARLRALGLRAAVEPVDPAAVQSALRQALDDPALAVLFRARDAVIDVHGRITAVDPLASAVRDDTLIVHQPVEPRRLAQAVQAAGVALEHARLQAELLMRVAEVNDSRARIVAAGDAERRRIERDLHDGAQQRLVGLALHLQSARRRKDLPPGLDGVLRLAVEQTQAGLGDIRALVRGIMPPALAAGGLPEALAELAEPDRVRIVCPPLGRLDPGLEMTAWFVVAEGVANATKHAQGHPVTVTVSTVDGWLVVNVADDGPGGADPDGDGLRKLADRVESQGGQLTVLGGAGTRLEARLPCAC